MSPVFRRENEYTFKIFSNEEERMLIHVLELDSFRYPERYPLVIKRNELDFVGL